METWPYLSSFPERKNLRKSSKEERKAIKMDREEEEEDMEEMMMMMIRNPENLRNQTSTEPITTTTCPSWKLYENPFYYSQQQQQQHQHPPPPPIHLPLSARKIAASLWDLTFFRPIMDSELARAHIIELKAELEFEHKLRKKVESMNKKLTKELSEERKGREAMERVCEELAKEIASDKAAIDRMKREMEEERKMLRMAEVLREERVQMKLTEAKILMEEKLLEFEVSKGVQIEISTFKMEQKKREELRMTTTTTTTATESTKMGLCENSDNNGAIRSTTIKRRASPEAENPHIKRGIKGFVEFPRVVRAISSKGRHLGSKLECQKAQLRLLLRQKSPIRSNNLIMS